VGQVCHSRQAAWNAGFILAPFQMHLSCPKPCCLAVACGAPRPRERAWQLWPAAECLCHHDPAVCVIVRGFDRIFVRCGTAYCYGRHNPIKRRLLVYIYLLTSLLRQSMAHMRAGQQGVHGGRMEGWTDGSMRGRWGTCAVRLWLACVWSASCCHSCQPSRPACLSCFERNGLL